MRKVLCAISLAAVAALGASGAQAAKVKQQPYSYGYNYDYYENNAAGAELATGAVVGAVVGLGVSQGWWGATVAGAALPTSVAGAAVVGGVAGIGAVALIDAAVQPCRGFHAMFLMNQEYCAQLNDRRLRQARR